MKILCVVEALLCALCSTDLNGKSCPKNEEEEKDELLLNSAYVLPYANKIQLG